MTRALAKREGQEVSNVRPMGVEALLLKAVESGNLDAIERVMNMRRELRDEAAKEAFFAALAEFQTAVPSIAKQKKGYGYMYAPIGDVEKAIKKGMEGSGLSKRWEQVEGENQVTITCIVTHVAGHSERTSIGPVPWDLLEKTERMNSLQHRAAVISYLQRYTVIAALGLATADDTDGVTPEQARAAKAARQPVAPPQQKPSAQKKADTTDEKKKLAPATDDAITGSTIKVIKSKMERAGIPESDFETRFGIPIEQTSAKDMNVVMSWLADPENK